MSATSENGRLSRAAGASLTAQQYTFMKLDSAGAFVRCTAATDLIAGILENAPASGDTAVVILRNAADTAKLSLGTGGATIGAKLTSDSTGKGVITTTGADQVGAIALEAGDASDIIEVMPVYSIVR